MSVTNPIRVIGTWEEMSADERDKSVSRGMDNIFNPALQEDIRSLIEQVRLEGDAAVIRALKDFDKVDLGGKSLRVSDEEYDAARAWISDELLEAIRDAIDHVRRFNENLTARGDWSFESEPGLIVGEKISPIASAGLFVPSGKG